MSVELQPNMQRFTGFGLLLLVLTLVALLLEMPGTVSIRDHARTELFAGMLALVILVYLAAVWLVVSRALSSCVVWIVFVVDVLARAMLLPAPPFLSCDIYRYVWDGQVQRAGINSYRFIPADLSLSALRNASIFPRINRITYARTIYPPAVQMLFALVGRISGTVQAMKIAVVTVELAGQLCMLQLLVMAGLPRENILIQAWNPLAIWSFACDDHVDAAAVGLIGLALIAHSRWHYSCAGGVLAAAALIKFLPLVLAAAFVRGETLWRPAFAGLAIVVVGYVCYLSASRHMLGFLTGYSIEEGLADGNGFWLLAGFVDLERLPSWSGKAYVAAVAVAFTLLALGIACGRSSQKIVPGSADDIVLRCGDPGVRCDRRHQSVLFLVFRLAGAFLCGDADAGGHLVLKCSSPADARPVQRTFYLALLVYVPVLVLAVVAIRHHWLAPFEPAAISERIH